MSNGRGGQGKEVRMAYLGVEPVGEECEREDAACAVRQLVPLHRLDADDRPEERRGNAINREAVGEIERGREIEKERRRRRKIIIIRSRKRKDTNLKESATPRSSSKSRGKIQTSMPKGQNSMNTTRRTRQSLNRSVLE